MTGDAVSFQDVVQLEERFLFKTRGAFQRHVMNRGLFDMDRIKALQEAVGRPPYAGDVVALEDAVVRSVALTEVEPVPFEWPDIPHYTFASRRLTRRPIWAYEVQDALLSFDITNYGRTQFYVFSAEGALINGLFFGAQPFVDPVADTIEAPAILVDDFFSKPNICHFMFDKLPRWSLAQQAFGVRRPLMFSQMGYARALFDILGQDVRFLTNNTMQRGTIAVKNLVILSNSMTAHGHPGCFGGTQHCDVIRQIAATVSTPEQGKRRRVVIDRAEGLPRNVSNKAAFEQVARKHGFEFHDPATMSVQEQASLFAETDVLMGVHGAGLTNLCFQPSGAKVVELMAPMCGTPAYWMMSQALGRDYHCIVCDDPEFGSVDPASVKHNAANNRRDVVVPVDALDALLTDLV